PGAEIPPAGGGALRRGSDASAAARSIAPRPPLPALAALRRRAARRRRAGDRRRQRRQQDEPAPDQPTERRAVRLALPEPRDGARRKPPLYRGAGPRAGSDTALRGDASAGHQPRSRAPARRRRRADSGADRL